MVLKGTKVNYTRKISHFALLIVPFVMNVMARSPPTSAASTSGYMMQAVGLLSGLPFCALFIKPIRERVGIIHTAFLGIDRPEDRPHTLNWLFTQTTANFLAAIPLAIYLGAIGKPELILALILINGIGDGLAEPVGIRFGKHKYVTSALFTDRRYVRSFEGSSCVFVVSLMVLLSFGSSFGTIQLVAALLTLPAVMTLVEAKAPHAWDNPLLFAIGSVVLFLILQFLP